MWNNLINQIKDLPPFVFNLLLATIALLCGFVIKFVSTLILKAYAKRNSDYSLFRSSVVRLNIPLTLFLPLLLLNVFTPLMNLDATWFTIVDKTIGVMLIISFAWLLIALIQIGEDYVHHVLDLRKEDNLRERKIRTQLRFLRKIAVLLILIVAAGAILLSFNNLRRLGTGLLTGVGIGGLIVGFAAQRSLGNLLAGFQIAFTQPLRLDDVLVVEGEWGKVEEINLTYVVLNIWDQRRLILPINYFLEKPFQNWTRNTSEILGTVFIHLDYSAPIDKIRMEFDRILQATELWDKRVGLIQVTGTTDKTIELRALVSAEDSGTAFDLRCLVREKLLAFISKEYPECLPMIRSQPARSTDTTAPAFAEQENIVRS